MSKKINLYSKLGQITDYILPLLVLFIAFRGNVSWIGQAFLVILALIFLILSLNSYRVSMDKENLYLNNLFVHKQVRIADVTGIERKPFYYSSSGGIAAYSYQLKYLNEGNERSTIIVVGKGKQYQGAWEGFKRSIRARA